jgi:hypothetical protein
MEGKTFHRLDGVYRLVADPVIRQRVGRAGLFTTVLLVVFGLVTSAALPQFTLGETGSASANRLWSSGAELNTTTANVEITGTSGTVSINGTTKRSGDYAFRANPTSSTGTFHKTWANAAQSNKFWFRTYLRIADDPSANTYIMQIGSGASGKISVQLTTTSTLQLRNEEDNTNIGSASSALSTNTWYRIEVYVDTTTLSSTDAELRLDGASVSSSTAENLAAGIDRLTWGSSASGTTDLYFDDIAINDSTGRAVDNWPGEGRLVHMNPNADGSNTAWIGDPSDTNDYDDVDEVTPNDDTDFIRSQTNNQLDDNNLEAATSAGIGANDAIKLVSVGVRIRPCGNASGGGPECPPAEIDINWEARITGGGNTEQSGSIAISDASGWITNDDDSAKLNKITLYDLPGTSTAPWTVTELDSAQIGVANRDSSGTGFRVSTTWLQVEYVDRSGGRLISSGFELNSATAGMEVSAVTNTPAINSTTFRSGAYALQTENGGGQEYARFYFESANSTGDYYLRAYLNIATAFDNSTATILSLLDTSNLRRAYLKLTTTSTLELWDEDGQIGSASSALSTSTWYRIELRLNTVPGGGSHVVDGRIDGVSFASSSTRNVGTGVARIGLGVNASDNMEASANTQGSLIWDDIALNKGVGATQNTWPGAGSIIHLRPNSDDATNTAWTNGFANVDEVTPNDGTDIVSETTTGDIDDYNLTDSSIGGSDTVNLVSFGVRFRTNSATQEDFKVRVKDSTTGIAIESNILSPASTTWTTNATADPKLFPLTAYTRPELSTAWTDTQLDTAQVGLRDVGGSGTVEVTAVWLLVDYSPPATIVVSGTCDQYDQTTDCTDDGSNQIRVAVNGSLQAQVDTTVDGAWAISGVTQPSSGDIITVFIDANADANEAVAVAKYDGTGDISGIKLFQRHLTIGSDDNQTITNANLASYDNSVSADEDIFFDVSAGNDLTVDSLGSYTDERLFIVTGNTFRPASGGGADVTTVHVEIDGTWTADSNVITVNGNWQNDGTFTAGTSSLTMNSTTTGRTLSGAMTGSSAFYDLTFNGSGGAWSFSAAAETDRDFIITAGSVTAPSGNLTVARNFTNNGTFTHNSGTVVLDTTTTATVTSASGGTTFNNFTSTAATKTIQFTKHTTGTPVFTFAGTFTITGTSGNLINIYSDTNGTQWKAHFNSNQTSVTYANIRDGGCNTGTANVFLGTDSTSAGNNDTCWVFPINRLWSGGAELQSATAGVETNFNDGSSQSISTSIKRSGEASWRVNTTSSISAFNKYFVNTPTQGKYWVRIYLYIATSPSARHNILNLNGAAKRIGVRLNTSNQLELWNEEDTVQIGSASSALSTATWYRIELHADTTTLSSTSAELRLNGSTTASGTANLAAAFDRIQFGVMDTNSTSDLYFDDIAINGPSSATNNWPGEGKIVHMQPNADGDNVAWTDFGGNSVDYDEVDEITPDDGTTYIHSSSAGNLEDVNLESASSAGISTNDTITAVSVGLRFRACNSGPACLIGAGDNYKARLKATGGGTVEESASINADNGSGYATNHNSSSANANLYPLTLLDLPGSSVTKWTPSDLDTAQIGMRHDTHENGFRTTTMWLLIEYIPVTNVTGTCDQYDQTTDCVDDGSNQIKVAVNGTLQPGADTTVDGSWSVGITQPNTGDIITVFIDGNADNNEAVAVTKYDGTGDITGVVLYQRHLTIGSADNQTLTNADLASYDNSVSGDEDIFFDVSAGNDLTVDSLGSYTDEELYIVVGNTFRPASGGGADVTTVHVENDGTWTADSNAITVAGNWQNDGTFSAGTSTTTFTSTSTGRTIAGTISGTTGKFYNLTFNGSGGEWTNSAALEIANDLTMTAGTLAGTNNVTVVGHTQGTSGVINRTGGTFKQGATVSKNFGTTSGTTAWTFSDLTFANDLGICTGITYTTQTGGTGGITVSGVLRIGESGDGSGCTTTLNAGNRTWTLSGTGGDPFQLLASPAGTLTASTSTFTYTGNNGAGNTTVQVATYYNLDINNNSETFVTEGNTTASNDLTVTNGVLDTTGSNHSLTVTRDLILSNTAGVGLTANGSTIAVSRHFTDSGDKYTMGTSTLTMNGTGTFTVANSSLFYILNLGYSTFTTTLSGNNFGVNNQLTFNGGTVDSPSSYIEANCAGTCTPVVFNSATSLTGTRSIYFRQTSTTGTLTVAGANFGSWALRLFTTSASATAATFNLGGGLTTTNTLLLEAAVGSTGNIFNTQNNSLTALTLSAGDESRTASWTINLGSSTVSLNGTVDSLRVASNGGSHTLNMGTSSVTVSGNVLFANGTGTIAVDDGTSTLTWVNTSGTATYAPNSQTLYNVTLNGSGGSVQPNAAAIIANDLTMTAGTLSGTQNITVNGTVQGTAGIINLTGGTFNQRVTANENFGTTSGSTAWTFYNLKFSNASVLDNWWTITTQTGGTGGITISNILQVGDTIDSDSIILTAGNRTWTLSGTTGDPFQVQTATAGFDAVTPGTSTFTYTGNNAGGNTTVERNPLGVGYYNLDINNSSETFVLEGNTTVGNDLTVTNGVLSTTGSNFSLTVTRDLVLANTTGVALTANGSTITVSRNWSDPGNKFTEGTSSTVILNGTGTIDEAGQFYALSIAYSTKTSTFLQNAIIAGGLTFNGGVATSSTTQTHSVTCTSVCTPVTFSSPTTLDESGGGTSTLVFQQNGSATLTVTGANYGTWNVSFRANGTGLTSPTVQLGGNVSTTGSATIRVNATGTTTGATFNTQNNSLTATTLQMGTTTATNSWTNNFGSSTITLTGTSNNGLAADAGNHTWNMQTSNWSIAGNLALASGASTITMNAGSSVVTFAMATTSRTLTSGNQSFYDVVVNSSTASRTLTLQDNFRTTRHFTITSGTFDVNSTGNYSVTIGGNYTNNSTFTARNGSVTFDGSSSQTLSGTLTGSSAFYNLTVTNSSGTNASDCERTGFVPSIDFDAAATVTNNTVFTTASSRIEFNSGSTYTLTNINWNGQAVGTRLYFRNSAVSGSWNLNVSGTQTAVSYVNVSRSNASSGNTIVASDGTNLDCGNNVNWNFTSPDAPSDLAQKKTNDTVIATGGWTNETSVKFTATASDTDSSDTLYLCVEKDLLGTGFSNTEDLCGTGVAYIGTPVTVTVTISGITDASEYHWQARVKDQGGLYGSWLSYGGNAESARDFGVDTTACTYAGTIYDGLVEDVDAAFNDGSLEELTANWDAFSCGASGLLRYDVSIGTTAGGTDILTWTNNGANEDTTQAGLNLHTNQRYYVNVRAIDNASNTSSVHSSNGQDVLPTISLTLGSTTITFSNLNDGNNRTDSKTLNLTTSTNAYGGYVIRQYATGVLTAGSFTIPMFQGGTYASPGSWPGGFCTGGSNCGYGYTSNDTTIQGSNKFSSGTLYASFATAAFGDIVADHTDAVTGATGPVTNQAFTITHKVAVDALQAAKNYQTEVLYIVTGTF